MPVAKDMRKVQTLSETTSVAADVLHPTPVCVTFNAGPCHELIVAEIARIAARCPKLFTSDTTSAPSCTPGLLVLYLWHAVLWRLWQQGSLNGAASTSIPRFDPKWPIPRSIAAFLATIGPYKEKVGKNMERSGQISFTLSSTPGIGSNVVVATYTAATSIVMTALDQSITNLGYYCRDAVSGVPRKYLVQSDTNAKTLLTYNPQTVASCLAECIHGSPLFEELPNKAVDGSYFAERIGSSSVAGPIWSPFHNYDTDMALITGGIASSTTDMLANRYKKTMVPYVFDCLITSATKLQDMQIVKMQFCQGMEMLDSFNPKIPLTGQKKCQGQELITVFVTNFVLSQNTINICLANFWKYLRQLEDSSYVPAADPDTNGAFLVMYLELAYQILLARTQQYNMYDLGGATNQALWAQKRYVDRGILQGEMHLPLADLIRRIGPIIDGGIIQMPTLLPLNAILVDASSVRTFVTTFVNNISDYSGQNRVAASIQRITFATNAAAAAVPNPSVLGFGGNSAAWSTISVAYNTSPANSVLTVYDHKVVGAMAAVLRSFIKNSTNGREMPVSHGHDNPLGEAASAILSVVDADAIIERVNNVIRYADTTGLVVSQQLLVEAIGFYSNMSSELAVTAAVFPLRNVAKTDQVFSSAPWRFNLGGQEFLSLYLGYVAGTGSNDIMKAIEAERKRYSLGQDAGGVLFRPIGNEGCFLRKALSVVFAPLSTVLRMGATAIGTVIGGPVGGAIAGNVVGAITDTIQKNVLDGPVTAETVEQQQQVSQYKSTQQQKPSPPPAMPAPAPQQRQTGQPKRRRRKNTSSYPRPKGVPSGRFSGGRVRQNAFGG